MLNRVTLTGRLTREVDLRYTNNGTAVGQFGLAVNRPFKNKAGEREADFINCVIWRKSAENLANFVHKGSLIGVDGRIQTRNYENNQGQKVYVTEVIVENFVLLESKNSDDHSNSHSSSPNRANQSSSKDPFANSGDAIDISDDDLPFD